MLNHFTKGVHSKQKNKPISHSKYSSVDFSVTNLITGTKHAKGRNMLHRINSPIHIITSNSNNKHNTSSVSSDKQHTLNHSTKAGCNSGNKTQLHLTRYFKGKNGDLTYVNIEPTSVIHKFYYLTDNTHHKTSKKPRHNHIYNNNNNSNCKGYNNNIKTESSSISTTSIKPIIANFVSLRNCISMKKNCVKSRNNHNINLNMKHLHAQTMHTNYPKKMNVATTTTIHVSDNTNHQHQLQSQTFHKYCNSNSKYKSFQSISASQTNNSSNSNVKRHLCKHELTTNNNTQLNANNITFNSNANTISHHNINSLHTPPSPSLEAIQNEIDRAMKSQSNKSKTKKYSVLKKALELILEHCSLNHYDSALITLLEKIISITHHIYTKFTTEISHLKESNDEYIKRIEKITNENEEKQQNLITVYSTEIQNLKKKIEILNHTTTSERSSSDKDKLIIQTTKNNSKIASINKENLSDLDALYFFDKVQMCNIDKCNSNTIIPTLPLALSRTASGVDSENNNNNNIVVYSCDGIHSDNNSNNSNVKLKKKKNLELVNIEYLNSNM